LKISQAMLILSELKDKKIDNNPIKILLITTYNN